MQQESEYTRDLTFLGNWPSEWVSHFKHQLLLFEVRNCVARVLYDGGGHESRHKTMIRAVKGSVMKRPVRGIKRFYLFTGDSLPLGIGTEWKLLSTVGARSDFASVIPDAYSFSWPEIGITDFQQHNTTMRERSDQLLDGGQVKKVAYWRGSSHQHPSRKEFIERVSSDSNFDVSDISVTGFKKMIDIGEFSVLVDLPGQGYSARLKHLLVSGRPVVVYPREQWDWVSLHLEPGVHYIPTITSADHLKQICEIAIYNDNVASRYAQNGLRVNSLLSIDTLHGAISDVIETCD